MSETSSERVIEQENFWEGDGVVDLNLRMWNRRNVFVTVLSSRDGEHSRPVVQFQGRLEMYQSCGKVVKDDRNWLWFDRSEVVSAKEVEREYGSFERCIEVRYNTLSKANGIDG